MIITYNDVTVLCYCVSKKNDERALCYCASIKHRMNQINYVTAP